MRFILARHCQTDANVRGHMQGQLDSPLNAFGEAQAEELGVRLRIFSITRIVCSDLRRATKTARIIIKKLSENGAKIPIRRDRRLREVDYGRIAGLSWRQAEYHYNIRKSDFCNPEENFFDYAAFGGENRKEVIDRQIKLINELTRKYPWDVILLVGHGSSLAALLTSLGHAPRAPQGSFRMLEYSPS